MTVRDDVAVAHAPFETYRRLGSEAPPGWRTVMLLPLGWLLLVACFVSWTTSGRLLFEHLSFASLAWCFVPLVQASWVSEVARRFGIASRPRVVALYYRGHFPWQALLLVVAGLCLVLPEPWSTFRWLLTTGVLPALVVGVALWCAVLTYAMFASGLSLSRSRALAATALHYTGCTLLFVSWFLVTGQLLPLWGIL